MRRAVTTLQSVHSLAVGGDTVSAESIAEIAGVPPQSIINLLWDAVSKKSATFDSMNKVVDEICAEGYSVLSLLGALVPKVITSDELNDVSKSKVSIRIAETEKNMIDGADEYLQLMTVCSLMLSCFQSQQHGGGK